MARQWGAPTDQLQLAGSRLGQQASELTLLRGVRRLQLRPEQTPLLGDHLLSAALAADGLGIAEWAGSAHVRLTGQADADAAAGTADSDLQSVAIHGRFGVLRRFSKLCFKGL
jgi:hypothetical protein